MRTVTAAEQSVLNSAHFATFARVLVEDADGTYRDLTNQDSLDWVQSGRIAQTIDQIVATGDFTFWRKQEGGNSLAPLDEASLLNRDIVPAYAPLIDVGRGIRCDFATVAIGASPGGSDWKRVFTGVIDRWNVEDDFVLVSARDAIGAEIADRWIEAETDYGTGPGRAIEDVMQDILTAWTTGITLYTPASPSFLVTTYTQQRSSVMDALQQLAALVGWVVQPRWDDGTSAYRLTFYEPDRAPASTDWTWADNRYEAIPNFSLDRLHIRNALSLWYTNTSGVRSQVTASDATSITNYDRQWMEIEEPDDSPIDTATEAQDMIDAALLDLKDPIANQEMKTFCFWPVHLSDYFQFNGNAVHYSANQAFGITGFRHEFRAGHVDTFIRTRGKPAGFIRPWIARGNVTAPSSAVRTFYQASAPTAEQIGDLWIDTDDGDRLYRWSGTAWVDVQDADITAAQAAADAAQTDATQALADAASAQSTADGRNTMFRQASAPTANATGDLWFDSDDGDRYYRWDGATWIDVLAEIPDGAVVEAKIATDAVSSAKIAALAVDTSELAADAVTAAKIAALTITAAEIAANTITAAKIAANTITTSELNVATLSAISANLGTVSAGTLNANVVVAADTFTASVAEFTGGVGIGATPAAQAKLHVQTAGVATPFIGAAIRAQSTHATNPFGIDIQFSGGAPNDQTQWFLRGVDTGSAFRFKILSDGGAHFKGNVGIGGAPDANVKLEIFQTVDTQYALTLNHSDADNPRGMFVHYTGGSPDSTGDYFYFGQDTSAARFRVSSDGDVWTSDAGILTSDRTIKENVVTTTPKLADVLALRIVNFNWADNFHPAGSASQTKKRIGYVAQEVEKIFPSLVTESAMRVEFGPDGSELPTPPELMKKSVRTGAIGSPILVKAFQEYVAQTDPRIEALEAWRPGVQTVLDDHESRLDVLEAA